MPGKMFRNIHEIFSSTIQGEGSNAGRLCSFLRLYGCPVGCTFCDTGYSKQDGHGKNIQKFNLTNKELAEQLAENFVVISGGEPASHPQFMEIINFLLLLNKTVAIETSGTRFFKIEDKRVWVTVSPKIHMAPSRYKETSYLMWAVADELKFVIEDKESWDFYSQEVVKFHSTQKNIPIYLQPEWSVKDKGLPVILDIIRRYPFIKLSVQTHKYLGLD